MAAKHIDADGNMVIEIMDNPRPKRMTAPSIGKGMKNATATKAAASQKTVLVRTPSPSPQAHNKRPWQQVTLEPDRIVERLKSGCGLKSKATVKSYVNLLSTARKMCGGVPTESLIRNPTGSIQLIEQQAQDAHLSAHSTASYMTAILAAIKHVLSCTSKAQLKQEISHWQAAHKKWHERAQQPYLQNRATEKQSKGWVSYEHFCQVRDTLVIGSKARLLFAMYSYIPPCRADLGHCRVLDHEPTQQQLATYQGNYIVLQPKGTTSLSFLHLRQFKTARCFGQVGVKTALPQVLVEEIRASMELHPRSYLFVQDFHVDKPYTRSAFSAMANKLFQRHTSNPDVNIQIIRHAYVTRSLEVYDVNKLNPCDQAGRALCEKRLNDIARAMAHSPDQQARYRFGLLSNGQPQVVGKRMVQRHATINQPVVLELLG